ncbi:hypothetical protein D3C84_435950 [compost metagenome]
MRALLLADKTAATDGAKPANGGDRRKEAVTADIGMRTDFQLFRLYDHMPKRHAFFYGQCRSFVQ